MSVCVVEGQLVNANVRTATAGPWRSAVSHMWLSVEAQWVEACAANKSDDRVLLEQGEELEVHMSCWRKVTRAYKTAAQVSSTANAHSTVAFLDTMAPPEQDTPMGPASTCASPTVPLLPGTATHLLPSAEPSGPVASPSHIQATASLSSAPPPSNTSARLPDLASSPPRSRKRRELEAAIVAATDARLLSSRKRQKAESSLQSYVERAEMVQRQQQDKADQEASAAIVLSARHDAKSKATAARLYAAQRKAVRHAKRSRKSAEKLKVIKEQLSAWHDSKELSLADIQSSLEAEQQTNRRLELELSQQSKAAGRAHALARARLHSAGTSSDSSDTDDSDWAPVQQPAGSSQQPALHVTSWLSNRSGQKYQPQMLTDLCRLMVQNSLPVKGVQGLLYDLTSLLTGSTVSKVRPLPTCLMVLRQCYCYIT